VKDVAHRVSERNIESLESYRIHFFLEEASKAVIEIGAMMSLLSAT